MDIIDQGQAFDAMNLAQALEAQKARADNTPRPTARGYCINPRCEDEFDGKEPGRLYCGPGCAEEHQRIITLQKR